MKKKRVRSLASLNKPQGNGLASDSQSHKPQEAREYAFLLLKFRLRSENELALRLRQKKFPDEIIRDTICFLKDRQFIDDRIFAKGWMDSRLKRPFGLRRIRQELVQKGLGKEIIEKTFAQAKEGYDEGSIVRQLAEQRFSKLKSIEPLKAKARVYAYLIRRGFSPDISSDIVKGL